MPSLFFAAAHLHLTKESCRVNKHLLFCASCFFLSSVSQATDLAYPGFTGVLRTPTAEIAPKGELSYQFNKFNDSDRSIDNTYNHVFSVGIGSNFEIGGRLTDWYNDDDVTLPSGFVQGQSRDLSGNFKLKLPTFNSMLPDIALGMSDFAGEATNFQSAYAVISKKLGKTQFSVGYAKGKDNAPLDGAFANIRYDLTPNFSLMSDYISDDLSAGVRYKFNLFNRLPLAIQASAQKDNQDNWDNAIGLTLSLPLDFNKKTSAVTDSKFTLESEHRNVDRFIQTLQSLGFTHVKVGKTGDTDVVTFDNHLYNHSYIDPLSIVFSYAYKYLGSKSRLKAIMLKQSVPLFAVQINLHDYGQFINNKGQSSFGQFKNTTKAWYPKSNYADNVNWIHSEITTNRSPIDIRIQPILNTSVGTEYGVFDYSLGLRTDVDIPLGRGTNVVAAATVPIDNSDDFEDGRIYGQQRITSQINQVVLQKHFRASSNISVLGGLGYNTIGEDGFLVGQTGALWQPGDGKNQFGGRVLYMNAKDDGVDDETIALATYKRNWNKYNTSASITYGQFYNEDMGVTTAVSRFFGDTELSAYMKFIDTDDISGGLQISLPLTPRKDKAIGNVVVRGTPRWSYSMETTIRDPDSPGSNRLRPNMLFAPGFNNSLGYDFYDRVRLTPDHFLNNLKRLKESTISLM